MAILRQHKIINGTITASGNSGVQQNIGGGVNPTVVAFLDVKGPVTGTTPSLTVTIQGSMDGVRFTQIATFTAITAALTGPQRITIPNVLDPYIQAVWTVSGTTPSFGSVICDFIMPPGN